MTIKQKDIILVSAITFLLILYLTSFLKDKNHIEKREEIKSALINQKNLQSINTLEFTDTSESIIISREKDYWIVSRPENPEIKMPADTSKIKNFLNEFTKVRSMYKISDNLSKNDSFGLTDSSVFSIRYYYNDSFEELLFGNQDFSLNSRYLMSGRKTSVYEINNEVDKYLTSSLNFWADGSLIFQELLPEGKLKADDIQRILVYENGKVTSSKNSTEARLLDLRHGGLPYAWEVTDSINKNAEMELRLELGNRSLIKLEFFASDTEEQSFILRQSIDSTDKIFYSKISRWTYNKIREIIL
ncbi:MAG: DUF4340 domain-containing protein [Treponema sp.]|nr:DUF4340 domain-containing protein [Treponema sp.]